jgi:hypothetical protein
MDLAIPLGDLSGPWRDIRIWGVRRREACAGFAALAAWGGGKRWDGGWGIDYDYEHEHEHAHYYCHAETFGSHCEETALLSGREDWGIL